MTGERAGVTGEGMVMKKRLGMTKGAGRWGWGSCVGPLCLHHQTVPLSRRHHAPPLHPSTIVFDPCSLVRHGRRSALSFVMAGLDPATQRAARRDGSPGQARG